MLQAQERRIEEAKWGHGPYCPIEQSLLSR